MIHNTYYECQHITQEEMQVMHLFSEYKHFIPLVMRLKTLSMTEADNPEEAAHIEFFWVGGDFLHGGAAHGKNN